MSENVSLVPSPPAQLPALVAKEPPKKQTRVKLIGIRAVMKWIKKSDIRLRPVNIQMQAKVGKYIEQEGQHHISRTLLAQNVEDLQRALVECEQMWTEAVCKQDEKKKEQAMKWRLNILAEMNVAAKNLSLVRKPDRDGNESGLPKVPTMPARTEITNNTQIIVNPEPKPLP